MPIVKNYGILWDRDQIFWKKGKGNGHIRGWKRGARRAEIDFDRQVAIYALYDASKQLVYVGQTGGADKAGLLGRIRRHSRGPRKDQWKFFSWFGLLEPIDGKIDRSNDPQVLTGEESRRDILQNLEFALLQISEPKSNKNGGTRRGRASLVRYEQVANKIEPELVSRLQALEARLATLEAGRSGIQPNKRVRKTVLTPARLSPK